MTCQNRTQRKMQDQDESTQTAIVETRASSLLRHDPDQSPLSALSLVETPRRWRYQAPKSGRMRQGTTRQEEESMRCLIHFAADHVAKRTMAGNQDNPSDPSSHIKLKIMVRTTLSVRDMVCRARRPKVK